MAHGPASLPHEEHVVHFYEDDRSLAETVGKFLGRGLASGERVIVVSTEAHRESFCAELRRNSIDVEGARAAGRMTFLDARETLARFMSDGAPDAVRFHRLADELLGRGGPVRLFGEMVDLLWRDGERAAALRLEELWNDLGKRHSFRLLCAYVIDGFYRSEDREDLARVCGAHTITDETTQQLELAFRQRRLEAFFEEAVVPMHWVDANGIIIRANKAELQMLGYTREEYVGQPIAKFHADAPAIEDMLARLLRHETLREYPARLRCKDGSIRQVLVDSSALLEDGKFAHTCCFTRDLTDRIYAEEARKLRESELRMRLLIDSIRDYAIFMLDATGRVETWNPGAERIKGYAAAEIVGRHFSIFYPDEDVRAGKCEMELRVATATGRFEDIGWRVRKDGSRFWANVVISAVRDDAGQLVGFAKVTRDLTERKHAEDERAARIVAEEANRAKDEFLAMLGHELRNPLAPIVTALQILKLRGDVGLSKEHIIIERQVEHVTRLVDDLLDVSRITQKKIELKTETFELATVVAKAVEIAGPIIEQRRHALVVGVARQGLAVTADPVRLAQVVANLLTNAAKYTDVNGRIELAAWRDGHEVVMEVKDNGIGIRPDLLPRVFELFVQGPRTLDRAEGGLGIGLTLVKTIVEMHGGTVVALSDGPGRGSAFVVRLLAAVEQPTSTPAIARTLTRTSAPRRILVVDDNADAAMLLAELCATLGHDVRVAHDGPDALELVTGEFRPEIAVLDIGLPVMDGYDLASRVRAELGPACRMFALTGYGQEHDVRRSRDAGFEAHLVKPVDPVRLLSLIDRDPTSA